MRWRDVKHGNVTQVKEKLPPLAYTISPIFSRFKAFVTDTFMILMPLMYFVFYVVMGSREEFSANMILGWLYIFIPHFFIIMILWYIKGQTPGYKSQDIKIVDKKLQKPSIEKLLLRYIIFFISVPAIIGVVLCFFRKDKKNLHDLLSGTMPISIEE